MASPVFFIKKKHGSLHLVQEYWELDEMSINNGYPLPLTSDILNMVSEARQNSSPS